MKTAVQKLKDEVFQLLEGVTLKSQMDNILLNTLFEEAEKEEKEQIIEAANFGLEHFGDIAEKYYNQTYNQNK